MTEQPKTCEVHPVGYRHRPAIVTPLEFHHLRPREWQRSLIDLAKSDPLTDTVVWIPDATPPVRSGKPLTATWSGRYGWVFDSDGILAGRTCHGNVHNGIVALMHEFAHMSYADGWILAHGAGSLIHTAKKTLRASGGELDDATWSAAAVALTGWAGAGQSLSWLLGRELWGAL